jgi:branched-chain amino acid aminotransferase
MKSCNLINNILAVREAQARGAVEPIMLNEAGEVAEGASCNVFVVERGALLTPPLEAGILPGVTREIVLEIAAAEKVPAREEMLDVERLLAAEEAFVTSTLKELMPVATIDGKRIGHGRCGPVTGRLLEAYRRYARSR